jgi:hypothetical protein
MARYEDHVVGNLTVEGQFKGPVSGLSNLTRGNDWFVDYTNGSDGNGGGTPDRAFKTLEAGYQAAVANQHDSVWLVAGSSGLQLNTSTDTFTWAKNYTHLRGLSAPVPFANRARIFHSNATNASLFTWSADGCILDNFYLSHGNGSATNLTAFTFSGDRNRINGVHFAGPQNATEGAANNYALLAITGGENYFTNSLIGSNTIAMSGTTPTLMAFSGAPERTRFDNCHFELYAGDTDVTVAEIASAERYVIFNQCLFHAMVNIGGTATPAQALDVASVNADVIIRKSDFIGFGAVADNGTNVYLTNDVNVQDARGIMLQWHASAAA